MRNRVTVRVCVPNHRGTWNECEVRRFGSRARAIRWATRLVERHPTERTRYQRAPHGFFCMLSDKHGWITDIDAPEVLVPSVGEIGWW